MKVLVTGGSGLLGANVVEALLCQGHEVNVLLRKTSNTIGLSGLKKTVHYGDLNDEDSIVSAAKGCNWIVHCAANTKQWKTSQGEHDQVNLEGTKNIIESAGRAGVEKLVFISTANTFPLSNDNGIQLNSYYVRSKRAAEDFVLAQNIVPAVILNPSFMIGARDSKPSSGQAILHYLNNKLVFTPAGGKSFIHVKDVADAVLSALHLDIEGKRMLLANDNRSYLSFFQLIGKLTNQDKTLIPIPPFISILGGAFGTLYGKLSGSMPKLNLENAEIINSNLFYNGDAAYRQLGITKRPLEEAILDAVEWFKGNGYCV